MIPPQFEIVRPFSQGLAGAFDGEHWGFIDKTGAWAIQPKFPPNGMETSGDFFNGSFMAGTLMGSNATYIFDEGLAVVIDDAYLGFNRSGVGYINKNGDWAILPQFSQADPFNDGVAYVNVGTSSTNKGGKGGYIDKQGNFIIQWKKWYMNAGHDGADD